MPKHPNHAVQATLRAAAERTIEAPAELAYHLIADFREHHPKILPAAFSGFRVEAGGLGAGTVARFDLRLSGRTRAVRMRVDEPEPGRVLTESDLGTGAVTTFTVEPAAPGARVRIETAWRPAGGGLAGLVERLAAPRLLGRLYAEEIDALERRAIQAGLGHRHDHSGESRPIGGVATRPSG